MADGKVVVETDLDSSGIEAGLSKLGGAVKAGVAALALGKVSNGLLEVSKAAVTAGTNFETGMSNVSAISGATGQDLDLLTEKAKEMGAKTKFSATEASEAFSYMAMAGWKTTDMLSGIDGVMNLAAASGENLASVSDIVTDAITAFGLSASDSGHFADVLAAASSNANTNVGMLGESFKYVAPVAGAMKYSVEDVSTALGLMANASVKGSTAGNSLRTALANMASPTKEMAAVMDEYGISLQNTDGTMKTLGEVIEDLRSNMGGLDEATQTAAASTLFGKEAMAGMLAIINASPADYEKLTAAIQNADGTAQNMSDTMQDNLQGSIVILESALEGLGIQFYESIEDPLKSAAQAGIDSVDRISKAFTEGGLKGAVEEAGKIFDEFLEDLEGTSKAAGNIVRPLKNTATLFTNIGKTAAPPAAKAIGLLAENMDKLVPVVTAGYAALKIYAPLSKTIATTTKANAAATAALTAMEKANALQLVATNGGLTIRQTLMGLYTGQVTAATAATGLWAKVQNTLNLTMAANPVGLLVTALAALTVGVGAYVLITGDASDQTRLFAEEEEKLHNQIDETASSIQKAKKAREENINGIVQEFGYTESLADELHSIVDENGRIKDGYADRAAFITSTLSDALGIEIELIDGQVQGYGELEDVIYRVIQKKKAEAVLASYEEDYQAAIKNRASAMQDLVRVSNEYEETQKKLKEAEIEQQEYLEENGILNQALTNTIDTLSAKMETLEDKVGKAKSSYEEYNNTISTYEGLSAAVIKGDASKIEQALMTIQTNFKYYGEASNEELRQQAIKAGEMMGLMGKAIESGIISATDGAVAETANMSALTLAELAKIPGGAAEVAAEIDPAMLGQLVGLSGSLSAEARSAVAGFLKGLQGADEGTKAKFVDACAGALEGLEGFDDIIPLAETNADAFLEALAASLEVQSPSAAVARIFEQVWPGASQGLDSGQGELTEKGNSTITSFLSGLNNSGLLEGARQVGSKIMGLFGAGISSQTGNSQAAGRANANAAQAGAGAVNPTAVGNTFGKLLNSGILGQGNMSQSAGRSIADMARTGAGQMNPAPVGQAFGKSYAGAISGTGGIARSSGGAIASAGLQGMASVSAHSAGYNFGAGFGGGIRSAIGSAVNAAASLASSALSTIKSVLKINSPSKETLALGGFTGKGFALGIEKEIPAVEKAGNKISTAMLKGVDVSAQLARMRSVMNMEKIAMGNAAAMKVVHEVVLNGDADSRGQQSKATTIHQTVNIYQPTKSATETARELKKVGRELAFGR